MKFKNSIFLSAAALSFLAVGQGDNLGGKDLTQTVFAEVETKDSDRNVILSKNAEKSVENTSENKVVNEEPDADKTSLDNGLNSNQPAVASAMALKMPAPEATNNAKYYLVKKKDKEDRYSVDTEKTIKQVITVDPNEIQKYFEYSALHNPADPNEQLEVKQLVGENGLVKLIEKFNELKPEDRFNTYKNSRVVTSRDQIDFKNDFQLGFETKIEWNKKDHGFWFGGDGLALFFEPLTANEVRMNAAGGHNLGLYSIAKDPNKVTNEEWDEINKIANKTISFNLSSNGFGKLNDNESLWKDNNVSYKYSSNNWYVYESSGNNAFPIEGTKIIYDEYRTITPHNGDGNSDEQEDGSINVKFDMKYDAKARVITTVISSKDLPKDENGADPTLKFTVPKEWSDDFYTIAFSASTGGSRADYTLKVNYFNYVTAPDVVAFNIASSGLDNNRPDQNDIYGMPNSVITFYPEGEEAPNNDENGVQVTKKIAVPSIGGKVLKKAQFLTLPDKPGDKPENITLNYGKKANLSYNFTLQDKNGKINQNLSDELNQSGFVGDAIEPYKPNSVIGNYKLIATVVNNQIVDGFTDTELQKDTVVNYIYSEIENAVANTVILKDKDNKEFGRTVITGEPGSKIDATKQIKDIMPEGYELVDSNQAIVKINEEKPEHVVRIQKKSTSGNTNTPGETTPPVTPDENNKEETKPEEKPENQHNNEVENQQSENTGKGEQSGNHNSSNVQTDSNKAGNGSYAGTHEATLPQTGEKNTVLATIIGAALSVLGIATLLGFKKKKED